MGEGCKELGLKFRAKMSDYILLLEENVNYVSLKSEYIRKNPNLKKNLKIREHDNGDEDEDTTEDETIVQKPVEKMAKQIERLEQENESNKKFSTELKTVKEKLKNQSMMLLKEEARLSHANKLSEMRAVEVITSDPHPLQDDPHLLSMLALLQDRDLFEVDPILDLISPISEDTYLGTISEGVSDFLDKNPKVPREIYLKKVNVMKEQVLIKLKEVPRFKPGSTANLARRERQLSRRGSRRDSIASTCSKRSRSRETRIMEENLNKQHKPGSPLPPTQ